MKVVGLGEKATLTDRQIRYLVVVRRDAIYICPSITTPFIGHRIIEARAEIAYSRSHKGNVLDGYGLSENGVGVILGQWFATSFVAILNVRAGCQVKGVDVVRSIVLNDGHDTLTHSGEDRCNNDRGNYTDDNSEDRQKRAELVRPYRLHRHFEDFVG